MNALQKRLEMLGLSEKEAAVYLAALESGPSTVVSLSQKTGVKRPTVYLAVESLTRNGLMSSFVQGKKTLLVAEEPTHLERLVEKERERLAVRIDEARRIIPELALRSMMGAGARPVVRYFDGIEGLNSVRRDFLNPQYTEVASFVNFDSLLRIFPRQNEVTKRRIQKKIASRVLYTSKNGPIDWLDDPKEYRQARYFSLPEGSFDGDLTLYGNKVSLTSFRGRPSSVVIEHAEISALLKTLFDLAWQKE